MTGGTPISGSGERPGPTRKRLPAADRRRQLIGIGLELLAEAPISELTVEEVSRRAGISRTLLFNYFPTRRDYHLAVIRAATNRIWRIAAPPADLPQEEWIAAVIERFIAFLERRHDPYIAIARGIAGSDREVNAIRIESRDRLARVLIQALDRKASPALELLLVGWIAFAEETVLTWVDRRVITREQLAAKLHESLLAIAALAKD